MTPEPRPNFWNQYIRTALNLVMKNPAVTPPILLGFAVAPLFITAIVLAIVFLWQ